MRFPSLNKISGILACTALVLALAGCNGGGSGGSTQTNPPPTPGGTTNVRSLDTISPTEWATLVPQGRILTVTIDNGVPVVDFELKDNLGNGLTGLENYTSANATALKPNFPNLSFAIAKLVPEDLATAAPSKWVSYIVTSMPTTSTATAPSRPTTDNTGTLTPNGNGTYRYTFYRNINTTKAFLDGYTYTGNNVKADLGDLTYNGSLTHRVTMQFSGSARGTGTNTQTGAASATASVVLQNPINAIYDFIPSTGQVTPALREIASIAKCNECHDKLAFHSGGGRVEARYCVVCHTDQRKYGYAEATTTATGYDATAGQRKIGGAAVGEMTAMVHRIHMGKELSKDGYNYADVKFDKLGYSILEGGQKMCSKCHTGSGPAATAQGENWNLKPSRLACGTCHDSVDFANGTGHGTVAEPITTHFTTDNACAGCHVNNPVYPMADVKIAHRTLNLTNHNPVVGKGLWNFTYELGTVTQSVSGGDVVFTFRFLTDRGVAGVLPADRTPVTDLIITPFAGGRTAPLAGFTSAPSFLLSWARTQDGVATPVDYNNLKADGTPSSSNFQPRTLSIANLTNSTLVGGAIIGSLTGPDANGFYTATVTNVANTFPDGATLRTVAIQGSFTQNAGTWDSNGDGVIGAGDTATAARQTIATTATVAGEARRKVIDSAKCGSCHEWFIGHGGSRVYDVQTCVMCHVPGLTTSGRGMTDAALSTYWNAGLFTAEQKVILKAWTTNATYPAGIDFTVNPVATTLLTNVALNFPQVTNNMKDMIHGIHAGKDRTTNPIKIVRNRTPSAVNIINGADIGFPGTLKKCDSCHTSTGYTTVPANTLASRDEAVNVAGNTTTILANSALNAVNPGDRMTTPFTAACISCHDNPPSHVANEGGQISVLRSALNTGGENCGECHTPADIAFRHQ